MLKIETLHATVADKPILNGLSLSVPAGEVHAIPETSLRADKWTLKQVQGDACLFAVEAQKLLGISLEGSVG